MTASRVFSAPDTVAEATRQRVEAAAAEIGYLPDRIAGALRAGQSNLVAAVVPSLANSLFAATLQGLADGLRERGLVLALAENRYDEAELTRLCREFLALRPRGLVLHDTPRDPALREMLRRSGVPVVEVGDLPEGSPLDRAVSFSNEAAAAALSRHLVGRGYRRIGLLTLPPALSHRAARRVAGWRGALAEAGLPHGANMLAECASGYAGGAAGFRKLLRARPDAVIGGGDVLGLGALLEAQRRGMRVPGDIAVASFDHYEIVEALAPRITTLRLPRREIGMRAAAELTAGESGTIVDLGFDLQPGEGD